MVWMIRQLVAVLGLLAVTGLGLTAVTQTEPKQDQAQTPPSTTQPADADTKQPEQPEQPDEAAPSMPTAEDVIKAFERERPTNVPIQPSVTSTPDTEKPKRPFTPETRARFPDGHTLVDRAGRPVHDGNWWTFAFEGDSDAVEPPMKLLPNRMLERMVFEAENAQNGAVFVISAEVTEFKGENYLLLRKLLRRRDHGNLHR